MQVHSRVKISFGLLFRYLLTRSGAVWLLLWAACMSNLGVGILTGSDAVRPLALAIGLTIIGGGLFAAAFWFGVVLLVAVVARATSPVWEYTIGEDTLSMSGGKTRFEFQWDDLRKSRTHRFGWRLWFGTRPSWYGLRGMQVLLPRIALSDDEAKLIDALLEGRTAHRAG